MTQSLDCAPLANLTQTLQADAERCRLASMAAAVQLGPMPNASQRDKFRDYIADHNDLAREIYRRLI